MHTEPVVIGRAEAHKLWQKYQTHKHYQNPMDAEIERIYKEISKGKLVIRALASVVSAGVDAEGMPALAIARADSAKCFLNLWSDGSARMATTEWVNGRTAATNTFGFPAGSFPDNRKINGRRHAVALTPHIPPDIRPRRGLANYHILWEAEWHMRPPVDPMLLRRIGKGDLWLVVGAWDLTPVERAAMAARL